VTASPLISVAIEMVEDPALPSASDVRSPETGGECLCISSPVVCCSIATDAHLGLLANIRVTFFPSPDRFPMRIRPVRWETKYIRQSTPVSIQRTPFPRPTSRISEPFVRYELFVCLCVPLTTVVWFDNLLCGLTLCMAISKYSIRVRTTPLF